MRRASAAFVALLLAVPALAAPTAAVPEIAGELRPMQPRFVAVGGRDAVIYYTQGSQGYEVVVTVAASTPDDGLSLRTVAMLAPGQRHVLSVGDATGAAPEALVIERRGDALVVISPEKPQHHASAR